jgi:hypothetical protein
MNLKKIYQLISEKKFVDPDKYTKDKILQLLRTQNSHPTLKSDIACLRLLLRIYFKQTPEERSVEHTKDYNSVGFSGSDDKILTSFAKQLIEKFWLSDAQMSILRLKMLKYSKQIADLLNNKVIDQTDGSHENNYINNIMSKWHWKNYQKYDFSNALKSDGKTYDFSKAPILDTHYSRRTMNLDNFENLLVQKSIQPITEFQDYVIDYNGKKIKVKALKVNTKKNLIIFDVFKQ